MGFWTEINICWSILKSCLKKAIIGCHQETLTSILIVMEYNGLEFLVRTFFVCYSQKGEGRNTWRYQIKYLSAWIWVESGRMCDTYVMFKVPWTCIGSGTSSLQITTHDMKAAMQTCDWLQYNMYWYALELGLDCIIITFHYWSNTFAY